MSERGTSLHRPNGTLARDGWACLVDPETAGWTYSGLRVLELAAGESRSFDTGPDEMLLLPLSGSATVTCGGSAAALDGRPSVWSGPTDFAYLPVGSAVTVSSVDGGRFALPAARASRRLDFRVEPAGKVPVELRGAGSCSRQVNNFCTPEAFEADKLIACEVLTPAGNWSSYPPHKHDEDRPGESVLEEIYYFEIDDDAAAAFGGTRGAQPAVGWATSRCTGPPPCWPRCAPATSCSSRTAGTARRWPPPATTSTTST